MATRPISKLKGGELPKFLEKPQLRKHHDTIIK